MLWEIYYPQSSRSIWYTKNLLSKYSSGSLHNTGLSKRNGATFKLSEIGWLAVHGLAKCPGSTGAGMFKQWDISFARPCIWQYTLLRVTPQCSSLQMEIAVQSTEWPQRIVAYLPLPPATFLDAILLGHPAGVFFSRHHCRFALHALYSLHLECSCRGRARCWRSPSPGRQ